MGSKGTCTGIAEARIYLYFWIVYKACRQTDYKVIVTVDIKSTKSYYLLEGT